MIGGCSSVSCYSGDSVVFSVSSFSALPNSLTEVGLGSTGSFKTGSAVHATDLSLEPVSP